MGLLIPTAKAEKTFNRRGSKPSSGAAARFGRQWVGYSMTLLASLLVSSSLNLGLALAGVSVGVFKADVTPPLGSPLCDALCPPSVGVNDTLSARGIILKSEGQKPVVLVAVDWVGIGNEGYLQWRAAVADACGVSPQRVAIHCLHQHDTPGCDYRAEEIAATAGLGGKLFPVEFTKEAMKRVAAAAREAVGSLKPVSKISYGMAPVKEVASNRRILGADGKVAFTRYTATADPKLRAFPEGVIDPNVRLVAFWDNDHPLAVLTYYATHPQSYYGKGIVSADFVGMARDQAAVREGTDLHLHFNGAGGNITAGKYNDGSEENRPVLASRLAKGMEDAWDTAQSISADGIEVNWKTVAVALPVATWYDEASSLAEMNDPKVLEVNRLQAARAVAWGRRCEAGETIDLARLRLGPIDILSLPGELFVEYQLAAQRMRPDSLVCVAAYGDYGPGYIGTAAAYSEGGYETGLVSRASRVGPRSETILTKAIQELLE